ncbi:AAA family ATPase [Candidatus Woesebacteria bacterium RIFCSPHIGHO2_02_FULL_38_9]|uniref:AAA family ATPase n=1 Tax=Candidatus Woesebacteria bacterium RIFCSPHIGHO2_01_FULL_39_28 TaxID=1802496 RepID=A0A1F7YGU6_9BACT|nr:MAG: AAA family ATPase [Candidatus Woesebacteria bacterium RIFCSPHIGHO2_01_FULL_39_28]OGM32580.1 MAG: AAA family ATPase [Candidatus Woesebacteria bacterium RIFCSPHIGHO2_02_FULL_38_9]OGM58720.1 MAG: AAA family ATPase [Candidatus Woesebacteria bacterium RIFCSPLOWO2_01_FULL_38_20]
MDQIPLAEKLRPKELSQFVGQEHLVGRDGIIKKLLDNRMGGEGFPSLIFWGPPGSGKTTLARIIASELEREFHEFSAVSASSKEIEKVIENVKPLLTPPIVFIDEIHRFNKAQQDKLLPHVEKGTIVFIGATTENPSFEVIGPLLSRTRVIVLKQLTFENLNIIIKKACKYLKIKLDKKTLEFLIESSNGDARVALNTLEIASNLGISKNPKGVATYHPSGVNAVNVKLKDIELALQRRQLTFDKQGDEFYNVISAFIKSMRASNVDAALYYLARMVTAGQDPLYIARRMVVFASEDVASPTALVVANEVFRACETIGYPECQENLAAGTVYLALAKKDRSAYNAYMAALEDVKRFGNLPVPLKILNAPTKLMKELGYGKSYEPYTKEDLLPDKLKGKKYYYNENKGGDK